MKRRGWLQLLGLTPVAAAVARLPEAPGVITATPPPAILLPPRIEVPGYKDLDGMARRLEARRDVTRYATWGGSDYRTLGPWDVTLEAELFGVEKAWQELIGQLVPVRFSFPKQPEVYLWSGYLSEMAITQSTQNEARTLLEFRGSERPALLAA